MMFCERTPLVLLHCEALYGRRPLARNHWQDAVHTGSEDNRPMPEFQHIIYAAFACLRHIPQKVKYF